MEDAHAWLNSSTNASIAGNFSFAHITTNTKIVTSYFPTKIYRINRILHRQNGRFEWKFANCNYQPNSIGECMPIVSCDCSEYKPDRYGLSATNEPSHQHTNYIIIIDETKY